ncbi:MAG: TldD/PmbA family protein [Bacteroidales bacterium]|nr:TldD/PmbA family protein [Bacteroidales bacterium]
MINNPTFYTDLFKTDIRTMEDTVAAALGRGGDYADLYFYSSKGSDIMLRDSQVSSGAISMDYGVGIRVLKGDRTGYAYTEDTSRPAMLNAAKSASVIADGAPETPPRPTFAFSGKPNPAADRYPFTKDWRTVPTTTGAAMLTTLEKKIRERDTRIQKVIAVLSSQVDDILMFNSLGELKYDTRPMGTIAVSIIFSDGKTTRNKHVSRSFRCGAEMLSEVLQEQMSVQITSGLDQALEAGRPKGGKMPVVMGAGASGILLHEAMGHAFEADFNRKGQSIFSDKMGKRVCMEGITIVDDATIKGNRGSLNFDDEGVPGQRTVMVQDGILTSFLHDRVSAAHYGVRPTGNGRRESFRFNPIPRMRATYMESGNARPEDIIASVSKGIYVDEFANGQVKIGEGDFTFYVKSGRLIENGRLTMPVTDINIIGNGPEALADIRAVGNDGLVDDSAWTCGKMQQVPVSCGIPTVLVGSLTVGGE